MEPRLIQQQSQKLILSPQIRQYLKLLQLPLAELEQAVEAEMEANPLLEEKQPERPEELAEGLAPNEPLKDNSEVKPGESFEAFERMDENSLESYNTLDGARQDPKDMEARRSFQEGLITKPEALSDFLLWQIRFLEFGEEEKAVAQEIVGNIDEDGYLRATPEEIAETCKADPAAVTKVLEKIQELDPPGIAARNLQEALLLQLKKKITDPIPSDLEAALKIVREHLPLLEKRDWPALAKSLNLPIETVKKAAAMIARLDPRPGRSFYTEESLAVIPDAAIMINEDEAGSYKIDIHDERIPELRISPYYRNMLRDKALDAKSRVFLKEKMQAALNFMQAMRLRKSTIREITEEIVKAQPEFLEKGFRHLKPLRLKDIAHSLGIHESTVSRAIQGKYVSTPQGLIPYKSFFSTALETSDGGSESQKSIMEKIRTLVHHEPPGKPLSDQDIVALMKAEGVVIARRTVAKYRDLLKILPSHLRRRK